MSIMEHFEAAIRKAGSYENYLNMVIAENDDIFQDEAIEAKAQLLRVGIGTDAILQKKCEAIKRKIKNKITKTLSIEDIEFIFDNRETMDVFNISKKINKEPGFIGVVISRLNKFNVKINTD